MQRLRVYGLIEDETHVRDVVDDHDSPLHVLLERLRQDRLELLGELDGDAVPDQLRAMGAREIAELAERSGVAERTMWRARAGRRTRRSTLERVAYTLRPDDPRETEGWRMMMEITEYAIEVGADRWATRSGPCTAIHGWPTSSSTTTRCCSPRSGRRRRSRPPTCVSLASPFGPSRTVQCYVSESVCVHGPRQWSLVVTTARSGDRSAHAGSSDDRGAEIEPRDPLVPQTTQTVGGDCR